MSGTTPIPDLTCRQINHFWSRVYKTDGCWLWTGGLYKDGYGQTCFNYKKCRTHRVAYKITYGDPGDLMVLHTCDNRKCVRPDHLFLGTRKDNAQDAVEKGRHSSCFFNEVYHPARKFYG